MYMVLWIFHFLCSMSSWFETWFDSKYYHILYRERNDEEAAGFIDHLVKFLDPAKDALFLDLACGNGRHCRQICKLGYSIHGADYSDKNISACKELSPDHLYFYRHDMREALPQQYDIILNLFTSFGYFESDEEHIQTLRNIFHGLKSDGVFVLDFLNLPSVRKCLVPEEHKELDQVHFQISKSISDGVIRKEILITDDQQQMKFHEDVNAYTKNDLESMLKSVGFDILHIFGDYTLGGFDSEESERLIVVAKKC